MNQPVRKRWLTLFTVVAGGIGLAVCLGVVNWKTGLFSDRLIPDRFRPARDSRSRPLFVAPPPPRHQIAVVHLDQSVVLESPNGTTQTIAYSSVVLDPRWIDLHYFSGWSREFEANADSQALVFFTGPTFEKGHPETPLGMVLHGDLKFSDQVVRAGNRSAAAQRAFVAVDHKGLLQFGFGPLTSNANQRYRLFIGGLHAFTRPPGEPPLGYKGVYGAMTMADVRIVYGVRSDGRLEVVETADGVLFPDLRRFVEAKGFVASFLPDHASKSRLIIPGQRLWSEEQAVWVSGGKPSITALPFMVRVVPRSQPPVVQGEGMEAAN